MGSTWWQLVDLELYTMPQVLYHVNKLLYRGDVVHFRCYIDLIRYCIYIKSDCDHQEDITILQSLESQWRRRGSRAYVVVNSNSQGVLPEWLQAIDFNRSILCLNFNWSMWLQVIQYACVKDDITSSVNTSGSCPSHFDWRWCDISNRDILCRMWWFWRNEL